MTDSTSIASLRADLAAKRAEIAELQRQVKAAKAAAEPERPQPRRLRFTKSTVKALPVPTDQTATYWDRDLSGLGLRVSVTGSKVYFLQGRTKAGRGVKITLGRSDRITTEQAREAARQHVAALSLGGNPAADRQAARQAERDRKKAATVDAAWKGFASDHLGKQRPKTISAYVAWYGRHIRPALGRHKLADLTAEHVKRLHRDVTLASGASTANRTLAVLSSLLSYAVDRGLVPANCARGAVKRHQEPHRERTLTDAELGALVAFLAGSTAVEARVCEFLLSSGARRGEALTLKWSDVNGPWWTVPAAVSKSRKAVRRPLNASALAVLAKVERRGELVFATNESRLSKWWIRARRDLGLADVHLHDLRHAAASLAISAGATLAGVGSMLGHGVHSQSMTKRYAHLSDAALAEASAALDDALRKARPAGNA